MHRLTCSIVLVLACVAALAIAATGRVSVAGAPAKDAWPDKLVLGVVPAEGGADIVQRAGPLREALSRTLGIDVEIKTATDYAGVITAMSHKHVDVAWFGPKSYVQASERAGARAIAMELNTDGTRGYFSEIIVRKGSGYKTMDDLRGKTFAFTDPNSTSGYLVPQILFTRDLKTPAEKYFKQVKFSGSHQASALAVKNGDVDAAAVNDMDLARIIESGHAMTDDFEVVWKSEQIPGSPMAVREDLPESLKAAIIGAFMMMNDDKLALKQLQNGGFVYINDKSYDVIRYLERLKQELPAK
jgi:phosphonate transport system substrate-binding protein